MNHRLLLNIINTKWEKIFWDAHSIKITLKSKSDTLYRTSCFCECDNYYGSEGVFFRWKLW